MRRIVLLIAAIAIAVAVYEGARQRSHSPAGRPGAVSSPAAGFSLQGVDGRPLDLANYRGKVVLLNFWATWCTPCRAEIPQFVAFQNTYGPQGLQLIGISMDDDAAPVREFYQQFRMNYPVAIGNAKLAQSYGGVLGLPVTFLIGRDGRIAAKYVGAADLGVLRQQIESLLQKK
ncbi:MAG TPA: TlpA disulfide reductase family protein [Candidatus Binatia bacterium]|nr:TlpA disulfide reductase family protein [Candidatus Binatia bacterium]